MMKRILVYSITIISVFSCSAQRNLSKVFSESQNDKRLEYKDSSGKYYSSWESSIGGLFLFVLVNKVEFDPVHTVVNIKGITSSGYDSKDTVGLCCVHYFLAKPVNGILTNIRNLGISGKEDKNRSVREGEFEFKTKVIKGDKLYFCSAAGSALQEFDIGKVCFQ